MHLTEWASKNEWIIFGQKSGNRVDLGRLDDFGEIHIREDCGERFREHRLPGSRRSLHEDIVSSGSRDHESPLGVLLSDDVLESRFGRLLSISFDVFFRVDRSIRWERIGSGEDAHE